MWSAEARAATATSMAGSDESEATQLLVESLNRCVHKRLRMASQLETYFADRRLFKKTFVNRPVLETCWSCWQRWSGVPLLRGCLGSTFDLCKRA